MSSTVAPGLSSSLAARWRFLASCASSSDWSGRFEIGAAILLVAVEEQRVEPAVEVVMVRDVAARARTRIELLQPPEQIAHGPRRPGPARRDRAPGGTEPPARRQSSRARRRKCHPYRLRRASARDRAGPRAARLRVAKRTATGGPLPSPKRVGLARRRRDRKRSPADIPTQECHQQSRPPPPPRATSAPAHGATIGASIRLAAAPGRPIEPAPAGSCCLPSLKQNPP